MTEEQIELRAKELVNKFYNIEFTSDSEYISEHMAKKIAITCVDEIIKYYPVANDDERSKSFHEFWQVVKIAITKM